MSRRINLFIIRFTGCLLVVGAAFGAAVAAVPKTIAVSSRQLRVSPATVPAGNQLRIQAQVANFSPQPVTAAVSFSFYSKGSGTSYPAATQTVSLAGSRLGPSTRQLVSVSAEIPGPQSGGWRKTVRAVLFVPNPQFRAFGPESVRLPGEPLQDGVAYDDGCVRLDVQRWEQVESVQITKQRAAPDRCDTVEIIAVVRSGPAQAGNFKAMVTVRGILPVTQTIECDVAAPDMPGRWFVRAVAVGGGDSDRAAVTAARPFLVTAAPELPPVVELSEADAAPVAADTAALEGMPAMETAAPELPPVVELSEAGAAPVAADTAALEGMPVMETAAPELPPVVELSEAGAAPVAADAAAREGVSPMEVAMPLAVVPEPGVELSEDVDPVPPDKPAAKVPLAVESAVSVRPETAGTPTETIHIPDVFRSPLSPGADGEIFSEPEPSPADVPEESLSGAGMAGLPAARSVRHALAPLDSSDELTGRLPPEPIAAPAVNPVRTTEPVATELSTPEVMPHLLRTVMTGLVERMDVTTAAEGVQVVVAADAAIRGSELSIFRIPESAEAPVITVFSRIVPETVRALSAAWSASVRAGQGSATHVVYQAEDGVQRNTISYIRVPDTEKLFGTAEPEGAAVVFDGDPFPDERTTFDSRYRVGYPAIVAWQDCLAVAWVRTYYAQPHSTIALVFSYDQGLSWTEPFALPGLENFSRPALGVGLSGELLLAVEASEVRGNFLWGTGSAGTVPLFRVQCLRIDYTSSDPQQFAGSGRWNVERLFDGMHIPGVSTVYQADGTADGERGPHIITSRFDGSIYAWFVMRTPPENDAGLYCVRSYDYAQSWTSIQSQSRPEIVPLARSVDAAAITVSQDGRLQQVCRRDRAVYYRQSENTVTVSTQAATGYSPVFCLDTAADHTVLVWLESTGTGTVRVQSGIVPESR